MNQHLRNIAIRAAKDIDLNYPGDSYPARLTDLIIKDLLDEFDKVKWIGDDQGWEQAVKSVKTELQKRYK
jgi:hypothetical protein